MARSPPVADGNAQDYRRLYRDQPLHAGLIIIIPQRPPDEQRALFDLALDTLGPLDDALVNAAVGPDLEDGAVRPPQSSTVSPLAMAMKHQNPKSIWLGETRPADRFLTGDGLAKSDAAEGVGCED